MFSYLPSFILCFIHYDPVIVFLIQNCLKALAGAHLGSTQRCWAMQCWCSSTLQPLSNYSVMKTDNNLQYVSRKCFCLFIFCKFDWRKQISSNSNNNKFSYDIFSFIHIVHIYLRGEVKGGNINTFLKLAHYFFPANSCKTALTEIFTHMNRKASLLENLISSF